jgi:hypothetical protein
MLMMCQTIFIYLYYCWLHTNWVTLIYTIPGKVFNTDYELYWKWKQETEVFICIACLICVPFTNAVLETRFLIPLLRSSKSSSCGLFNHFWRFTLGFQRIFLKVLLIIDELRNSVILLSQDMQVSWYWFSVIPLMLWLPYNTVKANFI